MIPLPGMLVREENSIQEPTFFSGPGVDNVFASSKLIGTCLVIAVVKPKTPTDVRLNRHWVMLLTEKLTVGWCPHGWLRPV